MKTLSLISLLTLSTSVFSADRNLTLGQVFLNKNTKSAIDIHYTVNKNLNEWCTGFESPLALGSFEAAQTIEALENGLYSCEGKFAQVSGGRMNAVSAFEISNCVLVNAVLLKAECPVKK